MARRRLASARRPVDVLNGGAADTDSDRDDAVAGHEAA
jgi:hypothetical protein